jgi:hypothetical protein
MRTLYTWEDGYCWSDNAGEEEEILDEQRERLLASPCPACGQRYRECVCPEFDPFEEEERDGNRT